MIPDLNMFHGKISDFLSFGFTLVMKLRNLILKISEIFYFLVKKIMSGLIKCCQTVSDLV